MAQAIAKHIRRLFGALLLTLMTVGVAHAITGVINLTDDGSGTVSGSAVVTITVPAGYELAGLALTGGTSTGSVTFTGGGTASISWPAHSDIFDAVLKLSSSPSLPPLLVSGGQAFDPDCDLSTSVAVTCNMYVSSDVAHIAPMELEIPSLPLPGAGNYSFVLSVYGLQPTSPMVAGIDFSHIGYDLSLNLMAVPVSPVPEPAAWVMFLLAGLALTARRGRSVRSH